MKRDTKKTPLEERMERVAAGYRGIEDKTTLLVFAEGNLLPEEVIHRIEKGREAFAREREAKAAWELAVVERERLTPSLRHLCGEAVAVARRRYGDDPEKMATFGVKKRAPKAPPASGKGKRVPSHGPSLVEEVVTTTIVEEVVIPERGPERRERASAPGRRAKANGRRR